MLKVINNKKIYIEEEHHHVVKHWITYCKTSNTSPALITLDHHTDTLQAFRYFCCECENELNVYDYDIANEMATKMLEETDINNFSFIDKLINDEHIDFVTRKDIISKAFVISFDYTDDGQDKGNDKIYYIPKDCYNSYLEIAEDKKYEIILSDSCIENDDLILCLNEIPVEYLSNYILDIDLDFFHTKKSINPDKKEAFYNLIRKAKIITIATEVEHVEENKLDEKVSVDYLLNQLLHHIEKALEKRK